MEVIPAASVLRYGATVPFVAPEALEAKLGVRFHLRMGANESAFGPAPQALEALREASLRTMHYGDPQSVSLRSALAERHGLSLPWITVASGIDDLLILLCRAYLNPADRVVTTEGSYPTFEFAARASGCEIVRVPYREDAPDLPALAEVPGAKIVYLANPDNPSGTFHASSDVTALRASMAADSLLILDEAYADFADIPEGMLGGVVRLRTFSKAHGLAGMRVGYALASPEVGEVLDRVRPHFGVNLLGQAAALASLEATEYLAEVRQRTEEGRRQLIRQAAELGLGARDTRTNFVLLDAGSRERADRLLERLLIQGVFVRKPVGSPLDRYVRVTVGTEAMNRAFGEVLRQVV